MGNKIVCGIIKGGNPRMIYCKIDSGIIDDVKNGNYAVEILPEPLDNIGLIWRNQGYENFALNIPTNGWEMNGGRIGPKFEIRKITGDALFLRRVGDDYNALEQDDYRRIIDSQFVGHIYPNGCWKPLCR